MVRVEEGRRQAAVFHSQKGRRKPIFMAAIGSTPFERGDEAGGFLIVTSAADEVWWAFDRRRWRGRGNAHGYGCASSHGTHSKSITYRVIPALTSHDAKRYQSGMPIVKTDDCPESVHLPIHKPAFRCSIKKPPHLITIRRPTFGT